MMTKNEKKHLWTGNIYCQYERIDRTQQQLFILRVQVPPKELSVRLGSTRERRLSNQRL